MRTARSTRAAAAVAALALLLPTSAMAQGDAPKPAIAPSPVATQEPPEAPVPTDWCAACDVDGDGTVGAGDAQVVSALLDTEVTAPEADVDGDGKVDWPDLGLIYEHRGETAPPEPAPQDVAPSAVTDQARPLPEKVVAVYHMLWEDSNSPRLLSTPEEVNVVNLAFFNGNPMQLPGWGSQTEKEFLDDVQKLRQRGVRFVLSVGGERGEVDLSDHQRFIDGVMAVNAKVPLDGIDWDIEAAKLKAADVVPITTELKRRRGPGFFATLAPNGSNVGEYIEVASELEKAGTLGMLSQQFYDFPGLTAEDVKGRLAQMKDAGLPESKLGIGMKTGTDDKTWTPREAAGHTREVKKDFPRLRGGFLWEASRGTEAWVQELEPVLKD